MGYSILLLPPHKINDQFVQRLLVALVLCGHTPFSKSGKGSCHLFTAFFKYILQ